MVVMFRSSKKREVTMRDRFILRVLMPPFLLLVVIGGVGFWQSNKILTSQAIDELQVAAKATSIRLEREMAIRETVLKNTADEISSIKAKYVSDLLQLESSRSGCREYYLQNYRFSGSPEGVCDVFSINLVYTRPNLELIEDTYIENAKNLQSTEISGINQRLSAFKQFFPETLAIMVIGDNNEIISSAVSGDTSITTEDFTDYAISATTQPVQGKILQINSYKIAVFAIPTEGGSVLAAYDVNNANYIRPTWMSTPIDTNEALAIVTESGQNVVYPGIRNELELLSNTQNIDENSSMKINLGGVENIVVSEDVGKSDWKILVTSPEAIVFATQRDTQLVLIIVAGIFVVGFLWVGTFFIKKTTDNLAQLVTGAMVYGSGRLDYKLVLNTPEKEFRQLAETMNYMAQRIARSEKEIDEKNKEFISIATHELRAPMTSIIGYLSMLQENLEKKLNKQDKMLINTAYDGTIRLRNLVNDMLDAARLEGGQEEFNIKKLDITKYINECVKSMDVVAKENKISIRYDEKSHGIVYADEAKLRIIMNNYLSNAIKYNHHGGKVVISHSQDKDQLITAVSSTGPTIPADQQEHMFEKFFRVDTPEHRKVTGTGIGMFVTKQYVLVMKGKVWFTSSPGQNTVFYFSLPMSGVESANNVSKTVTPKSANSKWIMRWRRRMR